MNITLSRHAKRRAKLYSIPESTIINIVESAHLTAGEQIIIKDIGLRFPLKIAVSVEEFTATVITAYPLKKGK